MTDRSVTSFFFMFCIRKDIVPRAEGSEERRRQILEAASEVFARKGFYEARMEDIAEQTGLSKGTLYLYFESKDDLIIAILDLIFQGEFNQLEKLDYLNLSASEAIRIIINLTLEGFSDMLKLMPVAYEFLALAFRNDVVQQALHEYLRRYMNILIPIIQNGIDSGEFREGSAEEIAIAVGAIVEGTILLSVYDKDLVEPEHHIQSGVRYLLEGIRAP